MDACPDLVISIGGVFAQPAGGLISPDTAPKTFITSRLAAWRTPDGAILPGHYTSHLANVAATKAARAGPPALLHGLVKEGDSPSKGGPAGN
jgi:hypothetical protein